MQTVHAAEDAARVVAWDHRDVLALAGVSRAQFEVEVRGRARRLAGAVRRPILLPELAEAPGTTV